MYISMVLFEMMSIQCFQNDMFFFWVTVIRWFGSEMTAMEVSNMFPSFLQKLTAGRQTISWGVSKVFTSPQNHVFCFFTLLAFIWKTLFKSFLFLPSTCFTPPETNIAPENRPFQKKQSYSNHPFSGVFVVSFREGFFDPKVSKSKNFPSCPWNIPKKILNQHEEQRAE